LYDINVIKANVAKLGYMLVWDGFFQSSANKSFERFVQLLSKICKNSEAKQSLIMAYDELAHNQSFYYLDKWLLDYHVLSAFQIDLLNNYPEEYGRTKKQMAKLRKVFKNKGLYYNI
jgi:hypothetical protein